MTPKEIKRLAQVLGVSNKKDWRFFYRIKELPELKIHSLKKLTMENTECPYCKGNVEVSMEDVEMDGLNHTQCPDCEMYFIFVPTIMISINTMQCPCINDEAEHNFVATNIRPISHTRMKCSNCGDERKATDEEMKEIKSKYLQYIG